jgi:outer membrane murein-binding lipoprotein Lpp
MVMKRVVAMLICSVALLAGCAGNGDYYRSIDQANKLNADVARAQAEAQAARYAALGTIAAGSGDAQTKLAAVMALALGTSGQAAPANTSMVPAAPQPSQALQWASILLPTVGQLGTGYYGMRTSITASNNARDLGISTNQAFTALGGSIATAGAAGYPFVQASTTINTASGGSVAGGGSVAPVTNTTTTTTTDNHSQTAPPYVVQPQPGRICTVDATGVMTCN